MATALPLDFDAQCPECKEDMVIQSSGNEVGSHYWIWECKCGCTVEEVANNVLVQIITLED